MPRGNPNFGKKKEEKKVDESQLNLTEEQKLQLRIKELEELLAQKEEENENLIVPDDAKVEIRQNISGTLLLKENKGKLVIHISLNKYQSTTRISYEELSVLYGSKPTLFTGGKVAITKVNCADKRITLKEVIEDMHLEDIYFNKDKVCPINIEEIFTDKVSNERFEKLVDNSKEVIEVIIDIANILYKKGQFNNNSKMNYLRQLLGRPNLFK